MTIAVELQMERSRKGTGLQFVTTPPKKHAETSVFVRQWRYLRFLFSSHVAFIDDRDYGLETLVEFIMAEGDNDISFGDNEEVSSYV